MTPFVPAIEVLDDAPPADACGGANEWCECGRSKSPFGRACEVCVRIERHQAEVARGRGEHHPAIAHLRSHGAATHLEIAAATGMKWPTVYRFLVRAKERGWVTGERDAETKNAAILWRIAR